MREGRPALVPTPQPTSVDHLNSVAPVHTWSYLLTRGLDLHVPWSLTHVPGHLNVFFGTYTCSWLLTPVSGHLRLSPATNTCPWPLTPVPDRLHLSLTVYTCPRPPTPVPRGHTSHLLYLCRTLSFMSQEEINDSGVFFPPFLST